MKSVVIAGGSGIIGTRLRSILSSKGYKVLILTRDKSKVANTPDHLFWSVSEGIIDKRLQKADYIVHLAGAGIADSRWSPNRKKRIIDSRVDSTRLIIDTLVDRSIRPMGYIAASAIGYYGDGGAQLLTEETPVVTQEFLSDVCVAWEDAAKQAAEVSNHLSILRIGTVLSPEGGALAKMDKTIPFGIANYIGSGEQYMSWIHLDDICGIIVHAIEHHIDGIYNAVAPEAISNKAFTDALRREINKKALLLPAPTMAIKLIFGEMARVVLNSSNVSADKIIETGYTFEYPTLATALAALYRPDSSM